MGTDVPPSGSGRCCSDTLAFMPNEGSMVPGRSRVVYWFQRIWGVLFRLAFIAAAIYCLYRVRFIIITVILAALAAFAIEPFVGHLHTRRYLRFIPAAT